MGGMRRKIGRMEILAQEMERILRQYPGLALEKKKGFLNSMFVFEGEEEEDSARTRFLSALSEARGIIAEIKESLEYEGVRIQSDEISEMWQSASSAADLLNCLRTTIGFLRSRMYDL